MKEKKIYGLIVIISLVVIFGSLAYGIYHSAYGVNTCGDSEAELLEYLKTSKKAEIELLKVEEYGPVKIVIYDHEKMGVCFSIFERKLFGVRWKHEGMDGLHENGLHSTFHVYRDIRNVPNYYIIVYGDNRDGSVDSYAMKSISQVARDGLESDWIIDFYKVDNLAELSGAEFKKDFQQFTPDGEIFVYEYPYVD